MKNGSYLWLLMITENITTRKNPGSLNTSKKISCGKLAKFREFENGWLFRKMNFRKRRTLYPFPLLSLRKSQKWITKAHKWPTHTYNSYKERNSKYFEKIPIKSSFSDKIRKWEKTFTNSGKSKHSTGNKFWWICRGNIKKLYANKWCHLPSRKHHSSARRDLTISWNTRQTFICPKNIVLSNKWFCKK